MRLIYLYIEKLILINFRNYREAYLDPNPELNLIIGANAQGKSNLLEALFLFTTGKSFRVMREIELIKWGEDFARVIVEIVQKSQKKVKIEIIFQIAKNIKNSLKIIKLNNKVVRCATNLVGAVNAVMFSPDDMEIIKGGPGIRRRFIDMQITQMSPSYCDNLRRYHKVLEQRNSLLRSSQSYEEKIPLLDIWDQQLSHYGTLLISKRLEVIRKLEELAKPVLMNITGSKECLRLSYSSTVSMERKMDEIVFNEGKEIFESSLKKRFKEHLDFIRKREIKYGATSIGPHRDDMNIFLNERPVKNFGSQGQQRTVSISLKLAERELIYNETGEEPLLLLDDVTSELDKNRSSQLLNYIRGKGQIFITQNHPDELFNSIKTSSFYINEGVIKTGVFN